MTNKDDCMLLIDECAVLSDDPLIAINDTRIAAILKRVGLYGSNNSDFAREQITKCASALRQIQGDLLNKRENVTHLQHRDFPMVDLAAMGFV